MKIAINKKYGGFSLSPLAVKRLAELQGKECYFFTHEIGGEYKPITLEEADNAFIWHAYSVPNPQDYRLYERGEDGTYKDANKRAVSISIDECRSSGRDNPLLIQVVEELGELANGKYANIQIVDIPDNVEWQIEEYDGWECVAEKHRIWD